jgi:hypothetical protein
MSRFGRKLPILRRCVTSAVTPLATEQRHSESDAKLPRADMTLRRTQSLTKLAADTTAEAEKVERHSDAPRNMAPAWKPGPARISLATGHDGGVTATSSVHNAAPHFWGHRPSVCEAAVPH